MKNKRDFDLIIWGATGFTGNLVCDYINKNYNERELRWAIAGRNEKKILNIAMDIEINQYIERSWLPDNGCFLETFNEQGMNLEERKGTRYYYDALMQEKDSGSELGDQLQEACNGDGQAQIVCGDGTEIDLSSGNLTLDVAGNIILDAGGGSGGLAIALSRLCNSVKLTEEDLSNVTPVTRECVQEANLSEQISVEDCDLVNQKVQGAYDAIIMRSVLQVLGPEQAEAALSNTATGLRLNGELYMVGRVLDDSRLTPIDSVAVNVMFLNVYQEGQAYTESESVSYTHLTLPTKA